MGCEKLLDAADLRTCLPNGSWMVEEGGQPPAWHDPGLLPGTSACGQGLAISLRGITVLAIDFGLILTARLRAEGYALPPLAGLALHEIIVNAVVHGNLGVSSGAATQWDDLAMRQSLIERALADPRKAALVVTAAAAWDGTRILVSIADEGAGYAACAVPNPGRRAAGRGLSIARAAGEVAVSANGRCTQLVLACADLVAG